MDKRYFVNDLRILSVFLAALLIFSIPFMTASVEAEDAKNDAQKDVNNIKELKWFAASCLGSTLPFIGALVLNNVATDYNSQHNITSCLSDDDLYTICCSLYGVGAFLPTVTPYFIHQFHPLIDSWENHPITSVLILMLTEGMLNYVGSH